MLSYVYDPSIYLPLEFEFRAKTCVGKEALRPRYLASRAYINLSKLSRKFVRELRITTTNCRVSFIDLYLVFPTTFRIVFLPHRNTVILLKLYRGTVTEPG